MTSPSVVVDVRFSFDVDAVPRGARTARRMSFWGRASVVLEVVDPDAFTPAVRLRGAASRRGAVDGVDLLLPGRDGSLWAPLGQRHGGEPMPLALFAGLSMSTDPDVRCEHPFDLRAPVVAVPGGLVPRHAGVERPETAIEDVALRGIECSRRDECESDLHRIAASLAVVDGRIWRRCHDPFWSGRYGEPGISLVFGPPDEPRAHYRAEADETETFRADRLDDFRTWRAFIAGRSRLPRLREPASAVEVIDGSYFTRDDLSTLTGRLDDLAAVALPLMDEASPDEFAAWTALRDGGRTLRTRWTREAATAALDGLWTVRKAVGRSRADGSEQASREFGEQSHRILRRAVLCEGYVPPARRALGPSDEKALDAFSGTGPAPA